MKLRTIVFTVIGLVLTATISHAHFGMVIPERNIVDQQQKNLTLQLSFSHPFEMIGMELAKPSKFYCLADDEKIDLLPSLQESKLMNHPSWQANHGLRRPGVYQYVMEPQPYWEPAEDIFIIHYTKTIVAAFGAEEGWDKPAGLPTEIIPLIRPFGNYAGNTFSGRVVVDGKPAAGQDVEVEFYNRDQRYQKASDYHITQVVRTDDQGVFHFACPFPGWWGFSALHEAGFTMKAPDNTEKAVELGGVLWVYFDAVR
ncbi:MAG: DUF4198 domain-containing protein [Desulfocapsaceae bacterium]|nr:DUF4198 domain-containing protein [Desulfocapsaceae bacterium]